jgi:tetratricopeptide (TPR) repeat protein
MEYMKKVFFLILILFSSFAACSGNKKTAKAPTVNPDAVMELRNADRLLSQKRCADALQAYQAFLKKYPTDADARNKLGLSYLCDSKPELAIPEFQTVLIKNPTYTDVHNNLGVAYMMMKNYPEAQKEFRIALQDSTYPVTGPYFNLAKLAYMQQSYEESRALAKKCMELLPKEAGPRLIYSMSLDKLGRDDEAIASFKDLIQIQPESLEGNYYLAELLMKKNKPCDARSYYTKVLDIDPIGELGQQSISALKTIKCPK